MRNSLVPFPNRAFFSSVTKLLVTIENGAYSGVVLRLSEIVIAEPLRMIHMEVMFFLLKCKRAQIWISIFLLQ